MARNTDVTENTEAEASTEAAPAAPKVDKREKKITLPDGTSVNRTTKIRELWATGDWDRSTIRDFINKECTSEDDAHVIAYQIVNAAVKDQAGGPNAAFAERKAAVKAAKKAPAPAVAEPAAAE